MEIGTIVTLCEDRGFGFIRPAGSRATLFLHTMQAEGFSDMAIGDIVSFSRGIGRDGRPRAVNVTFGNR